MSFLDCQNLLYNYQYGFDANHSKCENKEIDCTLPVEQETISRSRKQQTQYAKERLWRSLSTDNKCKNKYNIVRIVYRSDSQSKVDIDIFTKTLVDLMNMIRNENKHSSVMGDFNIDLLKYNSQNKQTFMLTIYLYLIVKYWLRIICQTGNNMSNSQTTNLVCKWSNMAYLRDRSWGHYYI